MMNPALTFSDVVSLITAPVYAAARA